MVTEERIYDFYASSALNAMIAKSPLKHYTEKDSIEDLKKDIQIICKGAHNYAVGMIEVRNNNIKFVPEELISKTEVFSLKEVFYILNEYQKDCEAKFNSLTTEAPDAKEWFIERYIKK